MINLKNKRTQAELSILAIAFVWGTTFVLVKDALADIGPFLFLGIRFLLAFVLLLVFCFSSFKTISMSTIKVGSLLGFFLFTGYVFQTVGLQYTSASHAGFVTGVSVVLVPIIDALMKKRFPNIITIISVILCMAGLYLISFDGSSFVFSYGDLLVLVCAFGFALHIIYVDRLSHQHDTAAITSIQILFVGVLCFLIGIFFETWPVKFSFSVINAVLITSVFATTLAFFLQNKMQRYSTPTRYAIVLTTEPIFAALAGYLWGGELLSKSALIGCSFILLAMLLAIVFQKSETSEVVNLSGKGSKVQKCES